MITPSLARGTSTRTIRALSLRQLSDHIITASSFALRGNALATASCRNSRCSLRRLRQRATAFRFGEAEQALLQALNAHAKLVRGGDVPASVLEVARDEVQGLAGDGAHRDARTDLASADRPADVPSAALQVSPESSARCAAFALGLFQQDDGTFVCGDGALYVAPLGRASLQPSNESWSGRRSCLRSALDTRRAPARQVQPPVGGGCSANAPDRTQQRQSGYSSARCNSRKAVAWRPAARRAAPRCNSSAGARAGDFGKARSALELALELASGATDSQKAASRTLNVFRCERHWQRWRQISATGQRQGFNCATRWRFKFLCGDRCTYMLRARSDDSPTSNAQPAPGYGVRGAA